MGVQFALTEKTSPGLPCQTTQVGATSTEYPKFAKITAPLPPSPGGPTGVQIPGQGGTSFDRKSGMPALQLIPAPAMTTTFLYLPSLIPLATWAGVGVGVVG